jgi:hypothetical protein
MVVVLEEVARAPVTAVEAVAKFEENRQAWNMGPDCSGLAGVGLTGEGAGCA